MANQAGNRRIANVQYARDWGGWTTIIVCNDRRCRCYSGICSQKSSRRSDHYHLVWPRILIRFTFTGLVRGEAKRNLTRGFPLARVKSSSLASLMLGHSCASCKCGHGPKDAGKGGSEALEIWHETAGSDRHCCCWEIYTRHCPWLSSR